MVASEVAGRWSEEAASSIRQLAKAKAKNEPPMNLKRAEQAGSCDGSLCSRSVNEVVGEAKFAGPS